jgi:hypothetical protein
MDSIKEYLIEHEGATEQDYCDEVAMEADRLADEAKDEGLYTPAPCKTCGKTRVLDLNTKECAICESVRQDTAGEEDLV